MRTGGRASWIYAPMQLARRIVFYILVGVYLGACPLSISYALGYLVRPGSEHGIIKTGLVHVATAPPGASVYFGKSRYTDRTPIVLRDVLPGTYPVTVLLKGHRPWRRQVPVKPGQATVLEHILLLPDALPDAMVLAGGFDDLLPFATRDILCLTRGPQVQDLVAYDAHAGSAWRPRLVSDVVATARIRSTIGRRDAGEGLLRVQAADGERWLWVELHRDGPRIHDVTELVAKPGRAGKDAAAGPAVRGLGVARRRLYLLLADGSLQVLDPDRPSTERMIMDPELLALTEPGGMFQLRILSDDTLLLMGEHGELATNQAPYLLVGEGVRDVAEDPRQGRLLIWQAERLGVLDLAAWRTSPERLAPVWVFQDGHNIQQAFWAHDGSHVVFRDDDRVRLLELGTPGEPALEELVQVKRHSAILYNDAWGRLYYLDRTTGDLRAIQLLPGSGSGGGLE